MTDLSIRQRLAQYAAEYPEEPAWDDVLQRARKGRKRVVTVLVLALSLIMIPAALAVPAVRQIFEGTPGTPSAVAGFSSANRLAERLPAIAQANGIARVNLSTVHGVLAVRTNSGPLDLWAAQQRTGVGTCWFATWRDERSDVASLASTPACDSSEPAAPVVYSYTARLPNWTTAVLIGRVYARDAVTATVTYGCGSRRTVPVVEHLFLTVFPAGTPVSEITVSKADGRQIATRRVAPSNAEGSLPGLSRERCGTNRTLQSATSTSSHRAMQHPPVIAVALTYTPKPYPPGRLVASGKSFRLKARWRIPLSYVTDALPPIFPPSSHGQACNRGIALQVWFKGGTSRTYGPCHWPTAVKNLAQVMTDQLGYLEQKTGELKPPG